MSEGEAIHFHLRKFENVEELKKYWQGSEGGLRRVEESPCGCALAWSSIETEDRGVVSSMERSFTCIYHGGTFPSKYSNLGELTALRDECNALEKRVKEIKKALKRAKIRGLMTKAQLSEIRKTALAKLTEDERAALGFDRQ